MLSRNLVTTAWHVFIWPSDMEGKYMLNKVCDRQSFSNWLGVRLTILYLKKVPYYQMTKYELHNNKTATKL
jgi:hypothetical protein